MPIWYVDLKGEPCDLREVSKRYQSRSINIVERDGMFMMMSEHFNLLKNDEEVRSIAKNLLKKINGAMRIVLNDFSPVEIHSVAHIDDKGHLSKSITFTLTVIEPREHSLDESIMPEQCWPDAAEQNKNVAKLLDFFSKELDWINLYRIWEVILEDQGSKVFKKGWVEEDIIKRFKQTANSFGAVGEDSRHGHERIPPPKSPMKLEDAQRLIRSLAEKWLEEKTGGIRGGSG